MAPLAMPVMVIGTALTAAEVREETTQMNDAEQQHGSDEGGQRRGGDGQRGDPELSGGHRQQTAHQQPAGLDPGEHPAQHGRQQQRDQLKDHEGQAGPEGAEVHDGAEADGHAVGGADEAEHAGQGDDGRGGEGRDPQQVQVEHG
ncbi:hypothetical protein [Streptomyces sp. NPDC001759]